VTLSISLSTIEFDLAGGPPAGGRFCILTGEGTGLGQWRNPRLWRFFLAVGFVGWPEAEFREHGVLASSREYALGCLVRDLKRDPRARLVERIVVYEIRRPMLPGEVHAIETINARLLREREAAKRPGRTQGALAFA